MKQFRKTLFPDRFLFPVLLLVAVFHCAALTYMAYQKTAFFLHDDGTEYLALAESFAKTGTLTNPAERYYEAPWSAPDAVRPEAFRSPFLPVSAGIFLFLAGGRIFGAAVFLALVHFVIMLAIYHGGRYLGGIKCGWTALGLFLLHPMFRLFTLRFSSEGYFTMFLLLYFTAFFSLQGWKKYAFTGLAGGLAALTRGTAGALLPAFAVYMLLRYFFKGDSAFPAEEKRHCLRNYLIYAGVFLLCLAPDGIRSYVHFGKCNPVYFLGGYNFFVGNNRDNAMAYRAENGTDFLKHQAKGWDRAIATAKSLPADMPPPEQNQRFMELTREEIHAMGAGEYLHMTMQKAWHFIRPWPLRGAHHELVFFAVGIFESILFLLGLLGMYFYIRRWDVLLFCWMIAGTGWAVHAITHLQMRHRIPFLDPVMILFAAVALTKLYSLLRKKPLEFSAPDHT